MVFLFVSSLFSFWFRPLAAVDDDVIIYDFSDAADMVQTADDKKSM